MNTPEILNRALSECLSHHMQHSAPNFPEHAEFVEAEKEFLDTLTEEQRVQYDRLTNVLLVAVESKEIEHYYRLGVKDGLTFSKGA